MNRMAFVRAVHQVLLCVLIVACVPIAAHAAEGSLTVTVTPPLFQLTIGPGESWTSNLKVVNNNSYAVTYYATPMDFAAEGEQGKGAFIPLIDSAEPGAAGSTLGHWIEISKDPIVVPAGMSREVQFTVRVPENADPGGHYAAILVGSQPDAENISGPQMKVSSFVSSLMFVRIKGDIREQGRIREFRTEKTLYETPKADFVLRFENLGNTHLKPQGDIILYNMWGKERGRVTINQASNFGNVLPNTIRKFAFVWEGEPSGLDIGRYSAVVTLSYGQDNKQSITAKTYFWVVPVVPVASTLGAVIFFLISVTWLIRRYIRRALALEKQRMPASVPALAHQAPTLSMETFIEPLKEGVVDLRSMRRGTPPVVRAASPVVHDALDRARGMSGDDSLTIFGFLQKYSLFFFFLAVVFAGGMGMWMYFDNVLVPARTYEITEMKSEAEEVTGE